MTTGQRPRSATGRQVVIRQWLASSLDPVALPAVAALAENSEVARVVCSAIPLRCDVVYCQVGSLMLFTVITGTDITVQ